MVVLRQGILAVALKLQEAADALSNNDVCARLRDTLSDHYRGTGNWGYYVDHFGDGDTGDVIFSCNGDTCRAPYEISGGDGAASKCVIDFDKSQDVVPRTIYEVEEDEADHYSAMAESLKKLNLYTELPLYERFIAKSEREAASSDDFAGKGKSFPILKPEDIMAAVRSIGRAGTGNLGPSGIKARIIAIAKRKGWEKNLPKAWQTAESKEAKHVSRETSHTSSPDTLRIVESTDWTQDLVLAESIASGVEKEVKIIAPGKGSSAFYTEAALKSSGPKVFKTGTQMFINHATRAEESERPEGDWHKLVGALTSDAVYKEAHKNGPGLYAMAKFASEVAPAILEKAPWSGVSIRANGRQLMEAGKPAMRDGVPVLSEFTACESIDIVTKAGAGGMILAEAARTAATEREDTSMSDEEKQQLREAVRIVTENRAREIATRSLADVSLIEAGKSRVIDSCLRNPLPMKDGTLDEAKFVETVKEEAKREGAYLSALMGGGRVQGMGAAPVQLTEAQIEANRNEEKRMKEASVSIFADLTGDQRAGEFAAKGRRAA